MTLTRDFLRTRRTIMPDRQTVTLTKYSRGTAGTAYSIENAELPSTTSMIELYAASGIMVQVNDFIVILSDIDLQGQVPEPNDTITKADGTVGRIQDVKPRLQDTRYQCLVRKNL